jgi:hypothetical protein
MKRYKMSKDQPPQIDCRVTNCKYYSGTGVCRNISPAITLNENGKFVCWSKKEVKTNKSDIVNLINDITSGFKNEFYQIVKQIEHINYKIEIINKELTCGKQVEKENP